MYADTSKYVSNLYEGMIVPLLAGWMNDIVLFFKQERILKSKITCEECGKASEMDKNT